MSWSVLESQAPEFAEFAEARLHNKVAYLATTRKDGSPRVHPFTPAERYVLFEFALDSVAITEYMGGETFRKRWKV